ncbi:MAG: C39 family peptidase [Clostridia bacterium]|nr:C39 family peptidase [Clostridia bacterium]
MKNKRRVLKPFVKYTIIASAAVLVCVVILVSAITALKGGRTGKLPPNPDIGKETIVKIELLDVYPESLRKLFDKHEEARGFVLSYFLEKDKKQEIDLSEFEDSEEMPLFLQWDTRWGFMDYGGEFVAVAGCGPVSLSMVGYHLTKNEELFSPDKVVEFALEEGYCVPDSGTSWTLMSEGSKKLGLTVEELPLVEGMIIDRLEQGKPVILIMGPGVFTSSGHYIVLRGYEDGYYLVNDPNSVKRTERKWKFSEFSDQILNIWAFSC